VKKLDNISQTGWNFSVCKNSNFWNDKMSGHTHRHWFVCNNFLELQIYGKA